MFFELYNISVLVYTKQFLFTSVLVAIGGFLFTLPAILWGVIILLSIMYKSNSLGIWWYVRNYNQQQGFSYSVYTMYSVCFVVYCDSTGILKNYFLHYFFFSRAHNKQKSMGIHLEMEKMLRLPRKII